ncbi:MAG TPA: hypothetical protein VGQ10_04040 [Vicinamibacterales bacterium]|nr:hypothetical protein [Vicinamibacterales bacterium]
MKRLGISGVCLSVGLIVALGTTVVTQRNQRNEVPAFEYDATWPKPLPNNWLTGNIGAMAIDSKDHIWVAHRPGSTTSLSERYGLTGDGECCFPAPPVLEFDQAGNLLQSWGPIHDDKGQLLGKQVWGPHPEVEWTLSEHGIYVDYKDNVWVGSQNPPSQVLKFTRDGKFILRIGKEESKSSNDTMSLAGPTGLVVDPKTNELFIADGYRNRRVIVFDADTGAYKRHWGAYGKRPPDGPLGGNPIEGKYDPNVRSQQFATVHCAMQSKDGLLYICDRVNNRIQVFQTNGTFVREGLVAPQTRGFGAVHALAFSPDREQRFLYVADGANKKVWILQRNDLRILGSFGTGGRGGGQLLIAHALAVDSKGNIYVGETINNNRVQRFRFTGMRPSSSN